jgi:hypothetical protein
MSPRQTLSPRDAALAVGVAAAAALAMGVALASASTPANFRARLAVLETQTQQSHSLMRPMPAGSLYPLDALCRGDPGAAAKRLHDGLAAFAAQANISLDVLDARPEADAASPSGLTPIRLRFTATGSYESAVTLLAALSRQRPDIFADGVDLTSKTSNVTVSFSGRAFCSV